MTNPRDEHGIGEFEEAWAAVARLQHQHEQIRDALLNAQGCRTCDMCPDCGHLAHGSANEIGHYDDCEIAAALARLDEQEQP